MDIEAAKQYTTEEYYRLLLATKFVGIVNVELCPEIIESMKAVVSFKDEQYNDQNGNHILRTVIDTDGNKGHFDATNIDVIEIKHPSVVWHLAFSRYDVLVSYLSENELFVVCPVNPVNLEGFVK